MSLFLAHCWRQMFSFHLKPGFRLCLTLISFNARKFLLLHFLQGWILTFTCLPIQLHLWCWSFFLCVQSGQGSGVGQSSDSTKTITTLLIKTGLILMVDYQNVKHTTRGPKPTCQGVQI